jgi:1-acyl-sn-glycerol-3-phosphate acyltransferase
MIGGIRALLFYVGYCLVTLVWGTISLLVAWALPHRLRFAFIIGFWTRVVLLWLRITCGIRAEVHGLEHIPETPCIVLSRHESTWETMFLQSLFHPQATLIKRELLWIPFFGWAFALTKPIAINRGSPRSALKKFIELGRERLDAGIWVVLFPEGTRMPQGEIGRFQAGGAALAAATELPVVVVAHDAGRCWPAHQFRKSPGLITVRIAPSIMTAGKGTKAINEEARQIMADLICELEA